ncbi:MAG: hypothetical protein ABJC98_11780 [Bacteroidota bacterium]
MKKYSLLIGLVLLLTACTKTDSKPSTTPTPPPPVAPKIPVVITNPISTLTNYAIVYNGTLTDTGGSKIIQLGIVLDTVSKPTTEKNFAKIAATALAGNGSFTVTSNPLLSSKTFYARTYASNSFGTGYGNEIQFTAVYHKTFDGDVNLTTQQEVIEFGAAHYTTINGGLFISNSVSDLTPLLGLTAVNNGFRVNNSQLVNFKGLDSLLITGVIFPNSFYVEYNQKLINFAGLSKLQLTRGGVQIDHNPLLENLDGLDSYEACSSGTLRIGECDKLSQLNGLKHMVFIGEDLQLINNAALKDISGLANLSEIHGELYVVNNPSLTNLNGLEKIDTLQDGVVIDNNAALRDISSLHNLRFIPGPVLGGIIQVSSNPLLESISCFSQITKVGYLTIQKNGVKSLAGLNNITTIINTLHIEENPALINLQGLERLTAAGRLDILNNAALVNFHGLEGLTQINSTGIALNVALNNSLQSLSGIENVLWAGGSIQIFNNPVLSGFCPLRNIFNNGYNQFYTATGNLTNPSQANVVADCH